MEGVELIDNFQKYILTPHVTILSYGAGFKIFAENFGNFAGLFSFVVDILGFMEQCSGDSLMVLIIMWAMLTVFSLLLTWLMAAMFSPLFFTLFLVSMLINVFMDHVVKPFFVSYTCPKGG